jgi:hypothetical protein
MGDMRDCRAGSTPQARRRLAQGETDRRPIGPGNEDATRTSAATKPVRRRLGSGLAQLNSLQNAASVGAAVGERASRASAAGPRQAAVQAGLVRSIRTGSRGTPSAARRRPRRRAGR